jgi:hypothetical protein
MSEPGKYGSGPIFGDLPNFRKYEIHALLRQQQSALREPAGSPSARPRLIHAGYGGFREQHEATEKLLNELTIPHVYRDGPKREHHWSGGWLEELVSLLVE